MNAIERHARKQVLLTRIAFERAQLRADLAQVNQAARLPNLFRGVVGGKLATSLFGVPSPAGRTGWLGTAVSLLKRYRLAAALVGGVAPIVRGKGRWRRLLGLGGLTTAAYAGWQFLQSRDRRP